MEAFHAVVRNLSGLFTGQQRKAHGMEQGDDSRKGKHLTREERVVIERCPMDFAPEAQGHSTLVLKHYCAAFMIVPPEGGLQPRAKMLGIVRRQFNKGGAFFCGHHFAPVPR